MPDTHLPKTLSYSSQRAGQIWGLTRRKWFLVAGGFAIVQASEAFAAYRLELFQNLPVFVLNIAMGTLAIASVVVAFCTPVRAG